MYVCMCVCVYVCVCVCVCVQDSGTSSLLVVSAVQVMFNTLMVYYALNPDREAERRISSSIVAYQEVSVCVCVCVCVYVCVYMCV